MTAALFLDRDGVLNAKPNEGSYVSTPAELKILPDVGVALAALRDQIPDLRLLVVTNQRGVATGAITPKALEEIHDHLRAALRADGAELDRIYVCPHEIDRCRCRKPAPGMLEQALEEFPEIELWRSALIGDALSDLEAAAAVGCASFLVGMDGRRREAIAHQAIEEGIGVHGTAATLAELIADGSVAHVLRGGVPAPGIVRTAFDEPGPIERSEAEA